MRSEASMSVADASNAMPATEIHNRNPNNNNWSDLQSDNPDWGDDSWSCPVPKAMNPWGEISAEGATGYMSLSAHA